MRAGRRIEIRVATEADGPVLAEIERNAPLQLGDSSFVIDRGGDYFAAARLMEDATVLLGSVDGEPAGVFCGALHEAMVGGQPRRMYYVHHARILPQFQRSGLGRAFTGRLGDIYRDRSDSDYWYISPQNARSQAFAAAATNKWSFGPFMVTLPASENAGPPAGRPATEHDAGRIVEMLNAFHEGEEMYLPYTADRLRSRVCRAPRQY
ncbi:MAG TPA: hypothetical protein VFY90_07615, partial [Tepidiformaceae bacterium]|nr:hypothetical protein [Tepidiformaceae bacterium]